MKDFFITHYDEIIKSLITLGILLLFKFISTNTIKRVGKISDLNEVRTRLIIKYVNITILITAAIAGSVIWSVDYEQLGVLLSSVFAIIGVALFAQWSILSNITSGIILFFSFPFKIGDRIRIQDKDFMEEAIIEDIRAFHIHLRTDNGELITYPNNLLLQKGVAVIEKPHEDDGSDTL
ncbi:mechanosensitive ion channel domain-containing protein [Leptobacterium sp. I13]|uniref:mechanosensitive ion channel domain-containing protein n=1 Tax=Leptobacterium meishanense TaxID=3128904 RepID=UPI0030ECF564